MQLSGAVPWRAHEQAVTTLYLEDFAVGLVIRSSTLVVTTADIKRFASEFDPQRFHLDEAAASKSIFRGLVASGWHTAAITMKLLVTSELSPAGGLIGLGVDDMRWPRPVMPGDELHVEAKVLEVRESKSNVAQGVVRIRVETKNQRHEMVQSFVANLLVQRRLDQSRE